MGLSSALQVEFLSSMLVRLFDRVKLEDARGEKLHIAELVTYLNDAILFAPSMLLGVQTVWRGRCDMAPRL